MDAHQSFLSRPQNCIEAAALGLPFSPSRLPVPVDFHPGSREKIEELTKRIERGEELFHPLDRSKLRAKD